MGVILILLGVSLLIATGFLAAFIYSVNDNQFNDEFSSKEKILF